MPAGFAIDRPFERGASVDCSLDYELTIVDSANPKTTVVPKRRFTAAVLDAAFQCAPSLAQSRGVLWAARRPVVRPLRDPDRFARARRLVPRLPAGRGRRALRRRAASRPRGERRDRQHQLPAVVAPRRSRGRLASRQAAGQDVPCRVGRFGPGDVVGWDRTRSCAASPRPRRRVPANLFPFANSARRPALAADSGGPDGQGRLRPGSRCSPCPRGRLAGRARRGPLPVSRCPPPICFHGRGRSLGPRATAGRSATPPEQMLATQGDRALARVVSREPCCPERLRGLSRPHLRGRSARGDGEDVSDPSSTAPHGARAAPAPSVCRSTIRVFSTAEAGDFETLVRRLVPRDLSAAEKPWPLDLAMIAGTPRGASFRSTRCWSPPAGRTRGRPRARRRARPAAALAAPRRDASAQVPAIGPPLYGGMARRRP